MNYKGIYNIGNTCYLNAGLQLVLHNKELCKMIILYSNKSDILNDIANFIKDYDDNNNKSLNPINIKQIVESKNSIFTGFNQQDSSEFIIYFIDIINDELKKNNFEINLYEHKVNVSIKCKLKSCLNTSSHIEKNNFLFLDINETTKNLDDSYREYKSRVKLEGDNIYYCSICKDNRLASKRIEIIDWSNHLIIILRRFQQFGLRLTKNNNEINIPILWRHNYKLIGFVFHSGSLYGGHYIYIGNYNNKWLIFDDCHVTEINIQTFEKYKNLAYIYYFQKI
jgi:ubiquitin C-terminal hydrolase